MFDLHAFRKSLENQIASHEERRAQLAPLFKQSLEPTALQIAKELDAYHLSGIALAQAHLDALAEWLTAPKKAA